MGRLLRIALGLILLLAALRAVAYVAYAVVALAAPFETFHLEAKMVLLTYRVQAGESLYPLWRDYPHVSNFYGPVYFVLVGLLGRAAGTDLSGLFLLGRAVTWLSALATTLGLGWYLNRRFGRGAAVAGALVSLGTAPMVGFSVMVRPDMMAELLGIAGFFASGQATRRGSYLGCVLLILAILTKQTAAIFLLAAALAWFFEGDWRRAVVMLVGCLAPLALIVAVVNAVLEPNFARSLVGDSTTPWALAAWLTTLGRLCQSSPDLLLLPVLGLFFWSRGRSRDIRLATLAVVVLVASLGTSAKRGSDLNYYLSLRIVEALAVGTLWHAASAAKTRRGQIAVVLAAAVAAVAVLPGLQFFTGQAVSTWRTASILSGPVGRSLARTYQQIGRMADDPDVRLLTDSALFDLYQKEHAAFGDPFLFRIQVDTGQICPDTMRQWIELEAYDLIVTTSDLSAPGYADYEFGLPMVLVERARVHYTLEGSNAGLFFYRRRGLRRPAPNSGGPGRSAPENRSRHDAELTAPAGVGPGR